MADSVTDSVTESPDYPTDDALLVGVAVAIPQPHASVLTSWRRRVGDPSADSVFPHVTLLPPTAIERRRPGRHREASGRRRRGTRVRS